ncbi:MAG: toll/interleukin-1 receptor domain-containing protein [Snowella sp.]|nr:toll/interleukin-1 receptor domain-containing protein [Snowella sp.]
MIDLKSYFELDFPDSATMKYELSFQSKLNPDKTVRFDAQAHIDFTSHVKFCSFYLPKITGITTFEMCKAALSFSLDVLALRGGTTLRLPKGNGIWTGQKLMVALNNEYSDGNEYIDLSICPLSSDIEYLVHDFIVAPPIYLYMEEDFSLEEEEKIRSLGKRYNVIIKLRGMRYAMDRIAKVQPVAFISHDSRDKEEIAKPLAIGLTKQGFSVWFDEFSLKPGDRLRESIEKEMKECKKCILILTPNFLSNSGWTASEFNMIFTREILEQKPLVIPVWHQISKENVYDYSPGLLNVLGVHWEAEDQDKIIRKIGSALDA